MLFLATLFSACVSGGATGQTLSNGAVPDDQPITAGYVGVAPVAVDLTQTPPSILGSDVVLQFPANAVTSREAFSTGLGDAAGRGGAGNSSIARVDPPGGTVAGLDTVPTFAGAFHSPFPSLFPRERTARIRNGLFPFVMIGNHPLAGGTTVIPAKISTVSLRLLNADGTLNLEVPFAPFEDLTLNSPNFEETNYRSGNQIQFADAIHRAQFFNSMGEDWHTILRPRIVNRVTVDIPAFVTVILADGKPHPVQAYRIHHPGQPTQLIEILDLLFNNLIFNEVVNEIVAGNYTTNALNTAMFANVALFSIDGQGNFAGCCVLGFHTYFLSPGSSPEPRWIFQFASWLSPGIFRGGFQDVTALSHETSEAFADPFVNTLVPVWQFPGVPANDNVDCQGNLEEGDPIEVLPIASVPITLKERHEVFTYHPQNIPLLQWFEMGAKSDAVDGAFSFPDETALTHSAIPCPL
jgi:hypothetical protein